MYTHLGKVAFRGTIGGGGLGFLKKAFHVCFIFYYIFFILHRNIEVSMLEKNQKIVLLSMMGILEQQILVKF